MEALIELISTPNLAYILLMLGIYGIIFEILNPGVGAPGVFGAICLILAFVGMQSLDISYIGLLFIASGILLVAAEVVIPSFGTLSISGTIAFALGGYNFVEKSLLTLGVSLWLIVLVTVINLALIFAIMTLYIKSRKLPLTTGTESIKGSKGKVISWDKNKGVVAAAGSRWDATSPQVLNLNKDDEITITDIDGLKLIIEPYNKK